MRKKADPTDTFLIEVRNKLRPFFRKEKVGYWRHLYWIKKEAPTSSFRRILKIVEDVEFYPFCGLGSTFPKDKRRIPDSAIRRTPALTSKREVYVAVSRLNYHKDRVLLALGLITDINIALNSGAVEIAAERLQALSKNCCWLCEKRCI